MPRLHPLGAVAAAIVFVAGCGSDATIGGAVETAAPSSSATVHEPAPTTTTARPDERRQVAIVGDSITVQSAEALGLAITGEVTIAARRGARTIDMVGEAEWLAASGPDVVVVNLGTNDEGCATIGGCPDGYRPNAGDVAAGLAQIVEPFEGACRLGVTIAYNLERPPMVNPTLEAMRRAGTLDSVIDWSSHWRDHEPADEKWLVDFAGHLSPAGADALATLVAETMDEVCGRA